MLEATTISVGSHPLGINDRTKFAPLSPIASLTKNMGAGDEEAFREFYDRYSNRLFAYLYVICDGNNELAREVTQQTMIKVARYARPFEHEEVFWKWLTVLARTAFVDESRKRIRYVKALQRLWEKSEPPDTLQNDNEVQARMTMSLQLLPEEDKSLLLKKYVEGMSIREIAQSGKNSEKAIESRLTRARNRMKEIVLTLKSNENTMGQ